MRMVRVHATYRRPAVMPLLGFSSSIPKRLRWPGLRRLWDRQTARLRMDASTGAWGRTRLSRAGPPRAPVNLALVRVLGQRNAFVLTFAGSMGIDEMKKAVMNMDARAHQIPAPTG